MSSDPGSRNRAPEALVLREQQARLQWCRGPPRWAPATAEQGVLGTLALSIFRVLRTGVQGCRRGGSCLMRPWRSLHGNPKSTGVPRASPLADMGMQVPGRRRTASFPVPLALGPSSLRTRPCIVARTLRDTPGDSESAFPDRREPLQHRRGAQDGVLGSPTCVTGDGRSLKLALPGAWGSPGGLSAGCSQYDRYTLPG